MRQRLLDEPSTQGLGSIARSAASALRPPFGWTRPMLCKYSPAHWCFHEVVACGFVVGWGGG
eukprot:2120524-Alexandrium_andersonii.AAC.1